MRQRPATVVILGSLLLLFAVGLAVWMRTADEQASPEASSPSAASRSDADAPRPESAQSTTTPPPLPGSHDVAAPPPPTAAPAAVPPSPPAAQETAPPAVPESPGSGGSASPSGAARQRDGAESTAASVPKEEILAAVTAVKPQIRACFEEALKQEQSLAGKVTVELEIEAREGKGRVLNGEVVDSQTHSPFFEACVLQRVANAEFPAPKGGGRLKVRYPFHFDPGGGFGGEAK